MEKCVYELLTLQGRGSEGLIVQHRLIGVVLFISCLSLYLREGTPSYRAIGW